MRPMLLVALLVLAPLAGCIGLPEGKGVQLDTATVARPLAANGTDAPATQTQETGVGSLRFFAHLPDLTPLAGVSVSVANRSATTDADGVARLTALPVGFHEITASKAGHRTARVGVNIGENLESYTEAALPVQAANVPETPAGHTHAGPMVIEFAGYFECAATYVIIAGDCLAVLRNVTDSAGVPLPTSTNDLNAFEFPLDLGWKSVVLELEWQESATSFTSGMSLSVEPAEAPADGHAARYGRVQGESILRMQLDAGIKHETATFEDMPNPLGGEVLRSRVFLLGEGHNPGGTNFLGVGAAMGQPFTLYVSVFYDAPADVGYSVKD